MDRLPVDDRYRGDQPGGLRYGFYAVLVMLAGADFGAGSWDLVAGSASRGARQRDLIEHSIGPVWEANHVWLVFVLVVLWTGFPPAFAAIASTLYIPLTGVAIGVIARGAAFAFRKNVEALAQRRLYGAAFASSSGPGPWRSSRSFSCPR